LNWALATPGSNDTPAKATPARVIRNVEFMVFDPPVLRLKLGTRQNAGKPESRLSLRLLNITTVMSKQTLPK
jgi:hypothetical protein